MAPEVIVGLDPSPASDVWALGYCIFSMRWGRPLFSPWEFTGPSGVLDCIEKMIGEMPRKWRDRARFDEYGWPTRDLEKGEAYPEFIGPPGESLLQRIKSTWNQPDSTILPDRTFPPDDSYHAEDKLPPSPFSPQYDHIVWNLGAVRVGKSTFLTLYTTMKKSSKHCRRLTMKKRNYFMIYCLRSSFMILL